MSRLSILTMGGLGLWTPISIVSLEECPPPVAVTTMRSMPVVRPDRSLKNTGLSPGAANVRDWLEPSVSRNLPVVSTFTITFFTPLSIAKTFTGKRISSSVLTTRGNDESTINGARTATLFSARPYAPSCPATTMTRTDPI